jgi:NADH:ubiquinone oxidoreductase subunit
MTVMYALDLFLTRLVLGWLHSMLAQQQCSVAMPLDWKATTLMNVNGTYTMHRSSGTRSTPRSRRASRKRRSTQRQGP